jgi:ATP-dependent exoDNAse (exonuclease V) alpha subunit
MKAQLDWLNYGDAYNLWYVAVTRAKRVLSVSPKFMTLVTDLKDLNANINQKNINKVTQVRDYF